MKTHIVFLFILSLVQPPIVLAEDGFELLNKTETRYWEQAAKYFETCLQIPDETADAHAERCVPERIRNRRKQINIINSDTLEFDGEQIRIANIDAPQIKNAKCQAEQFLGQQTQMNISMMRNDMLIKRLGKDNGGRTLALLRYKANLGWPHENIAYDIGKSLIQSNLAMPYKKGKPYDWCSSKTEK